MGKKILFVISFIGLIAGLIAIGNTVNKYHSDVDAINEAHDSCVDLQNELNANAEEFNNLPDDFPDMKNAIIAEHNRQIDQFNALCG